MRTIVVDITQTVLPSSKDDFFLAQLNASLQIDLGQEDQKGIKARKVACTSSEPVWAQGW